MYEYFIKKAKTNVVLLRYFDLPVFNNIRELSDLIHVDRSLVEKYFTNPFRYYKKYKIKKSNGKLREIKQPNKELKAIQAWILRNILDKITPSKYATAYVIGKNLSDNIKPHINNRYFLCLDIKEFFPSINIYLVIDMFINIGYSSRAALLLGRLCTCYDYLPQGGVTSPSISNIIASRLDRRIAGYCNRRNITYTRYADDIVFSSNNPKILSHTKYVVSKIIESENFTINKDKTRFLGPKQSCVITGLVKNNSQPRYGIGKKQKRLMRVVMHRYITSKNIDEKYKTEASINGWLEYVKSIDNESYNQMSRYWQKLKQSTIPFTP
jgi:RNA-directed DNA polymerase